MAEDTTTTSLQHAAPAPGGIFSGSIGSKPADKAPVTAADKLREFEDKTFGKDAPRINGDLERGIGSPYSRMTVQQKAQHVALEHLVKCEKAMADASANLEAAKLKHDAAVKASDDAAKAIDTASTKAA